MAKLTKGIFGPVSGKIGSLVGATWKIRMPLLVDALAYFFKLLNLAGD